jgi:acetyl-CoA C-acetyltransferase
MNGTGAEKQPVWLAAGLRTPFARVDGPLAGRDALSLSLPVVQAMAGQVSGPIDLGIWGAVAVNLAYSNLAREIWLEAGRDPHVPTLTTILQCCTSMVAAFEAAGLLRSGGHALALVGGSESMSRIQIGLGPNLSVWLRRWTHARPSPVVSGRCGPEIPGCAAHVRDQEPGHRQAWATLRGWRKPGRSIAGSRMNSRWSHRRRRGAGPQVVQ